MKESENNASERGNQAENLAAGFLRRAGIKIVARNYRCKGGEIDLICEDGNTLVFVEVRLRRSADFGGALASITTAKQRRIMRAAEHYLLRYGKPNRACRFDCVLLDTLSEAHIDWQRDAFSAN